MRLKLWQVDAFAERPFSGNPAAVVPLQSWLPDAQMQAIANENNLAETAFFVPHATGMGSSDLRWFTPTVEVPLCGHGTLASAHALWETGRLGRDREARFHTRSGVLTARLAAGRIEMDFPSIPVEEAPLLPEAQLAFGVTPRLSAHTPVAREVNYLLEFESEAAVAALRPDFPALRKIHWGFIVTARSTRGPYDFVSRYFAAGQGIDEDPVTGSAHCSLAPYWASRLGKDELVGHQISTRGGVVHCTLRGDRVGLAGQAVTVLRGELFA
jgi:PhzF family phenazine biosynthesis protein